MRTYKGVVQAAMRAVGERRRASRSTRQLHLHFGCRMEDQDQRRVVWITSSPCSQSESRMSIDQNDFSVVIYNTASEYDP